MGEEISKWFNLSTNLICGAKVLDNVAPESCRETDKKYMYVGTSVKSGFSKINVVFPTNSNFQFSPTPTSISLSSLRNYWGRTVVVGDGQINT